MSFANVQPAWKAFALFQALKLSLAFMVATAFLLAKIEITTAQQVNPSFPLLQRINQQATTLISKGRYQDALPVAEAAVAIAAQSLGNVGRASPMANLLRGTVKGNLATVHLRLGHYATAETLLKELVAYWASIGKSNSYEAGAAAILLANLYQDTGRYDEAEPLIKRALTIYQKPKYREQYDLRPDIATALNHLGRTYEALGRFNEAEQFYVQAHQIDETLHRDGQVGYADIVHSKTDLAMFRLKQGRAADAYQLLKDAWSISQQTDLGHEYVPGLLEAWALAAQAAGNTSEARDLISRTLDARRKAMGAGHPHVAMTLDLLGRLYLADGKFSEAQEKFDQALRMLRDRLGPRHGLLVPVLYDLAGVAFRQSRWKDALDHFNRGIDIDLSQQKLRGRLTQGALYGRRPAQGGHGLVIKSFAKAAFRFAGRNSERMRSLLPRAFRIAQSALHSQAAAALAQMAVRTAKGDPQLSSLVRQRQDLWGTWGKLDEQLFSARARVDKDRNLKMEQVLTARLADIASKIAELDKRLARAFPEYATLASPEPLEISQVQTYLRPNEALVLILDTPKVEPTPGETFIWVITKSDARWVRSNLGSAALTEHVAALRCGLDPALWDDATDWPEEAEELLRQKMSQIARHKRCEALTRAEPKHELSGLRPLPPTLPFDAARAHALYKALFGEVEGLIRDKNLLIVPSGALTSLPFSVLATKPPRKRIPEALVDYRDIAWLGTRQPIAVLPSVASLKALRATAKPSTAGLELLGIGNPLLDGPDKRFARLAQKARAQQVCHKQPASELRVASLRGSRIGPFQSMFRGGHADVTRLRQLAPLPETADELCRIRTRLGVPESDILLGSRATENAIKSLSETGKLRQYRTVHFATHGALSGQIQGSAEPGLVLTPPQDGSDAKALERDDGYLTASEIAGLKLDAGWVILSACNTAAGTGEHTQAFSGLARAFFYAGARALLVSHWEVGSLSSVELTTHAFAELGAKPQMGRAEAFRLSMAELIAKGEPWQAHPSQWAPFVVVGEGGAAR